MSSSPFPLRRLIIQMIWKATIESDEDMTNPAEPLQSEDSGPEEPQTRKRKMSDRLEPKTLDGWDLVERKM